MAKQELAWCKISHQFCKDDCNHCIEWLTVCDDCGEYGHTDSGDWIGDFDGHNPPLVYCGPCGAKRGLTVINSDGQVVETQETILETLISEATRP